MKKSHLIIGIGNIYRGDDGAGLLAARALKAQPNAPLDCIDIQESDGSAFALMELWRDRNHVVIIDAMNLDGEKVGDLLLFDGLRSLLPLDQLRVSTHAFGLQEAIALSASLGALPKQLTVIAIIGADFGMKEGLSPAVATAVQHWVQEFPAGLKATLSDIGPTNQRSEDARNVTDEQLNQPGQSYC